VGDAEADPEEPSSVTAIAGAPAARLQQREQERRGDRDGQREQDVGAAAEVGGGHEADDPEVARQPGGVGGREHPEELVQADDAQARRGRRRTPSRPARRR
jgi:hypothetical protein